MNDVLDYLQKNEDHFVEELKEFLRIPSISADSQYRPAMADAAEFVANQFRQMGLDTEIIPTEGHSIVYAEWSNTPDAPTALVYGHYDVQPPDPLDLWTTPPFEPDVRKGHIYARGATDDKGQMLTHVKSVEAWLKTVGSLPVNVKFVIEGEEEVGSDNLDRFLEDNKEKLNCDIAVVSDTSQYGPDMPAITYGLRGILACEIRLTGPNRDLHSGVFGGSVANPANVLAKLIASLHDDNGRVQVPGFYDDIPELPQDERDRLAALPFDESRYFADLGVSGGYGEGGFTTTERRWARPTCDVNGMVSGYTGEGPKTIVPSKSVAKITCRLVPDQCPEKLTENLKAYLSDQCPAGIQFEFESQHGCESLVFETNSQYMEAAEKAIETAFGTRPVFIREGGSIPVVKSFRDILGVDTLLLGWGQNTDNLHSPDEHFSLQDFQRGIQASAHLWNELSKS